MTAPEVTINVPTFMGWMHQAIDTLHPRDFQDADDTVLAVRAHLLQQWVLAVAQAEHVAIPGFEKHTQDALAIIASPHRSPSALKLIDGGMG